MSMMAVEIRSSEQVNATRRLVQTRAVAIGLSTLKMTKFVTAASELARNTLVHGGGGTMTIEDIQRQGKPGLQLEFRDQGRRIADVQQAMRDGFTTAKSVGLGLGGGATPGWRIRDFISENQNIYRSWWLSKFYFQFELQEPK